VLPLIMPPFVGAVALQLIFGRSGSVNLLLNDAFGFTLPIMDGLGGVIFVEAIHYFPFILMNLTVALRNIAVRASDASAVQVESGLNPGDVVVTAGVQALRPGQKVRLIETKS